MLLGALVGNGGAFTFLHGEVGGTATLFGRLSPAKCTARLVALPLGLDLLFCTLVLKVWRVRQIVRRASSGVRPGSFRRSTSSLSSSLCTVFSWGSSSTADQALLLFSAFFAVEFGFLLLWALLAPPNPSKEFSRLAPNLYVYECTSRGSSSTAAYGLGDGLLIALMACHVPVVLWALELAWTTRGHVAELNESERIALATINLTLVGFFTLTIQARPTIQTLPLATTVPTSSAPSPSSYSSSSTTRRPPSCSCAASALCGSPPSPPSSSSLPNSTASRPRATWPARSPATPSPPPRPPTPHDPSVRRMPSIFIGVD
jgi:hypothetical protein